MLSNLAAWLEGTWTEPGGHGVFCFAARVVEALFSCGWFGATRGAILGREVRLSVW